MNFWKGFEKRAGKPIPQRVLGHALVGAGLGGAVGAAADKDNRWRGGAVGALAGGAVGSVAGHIRHKGIAAAAKAKRKPRKKPDIEAMKQVLREAQEEVRKMRRHVRGR